MYQGKHFLVRQLLDSCKHAKSQNLTTFAQLDECDTFSLHINIITEDEPDS